MQKYSFLFLLFTGFFHSNFVQAELCSSLLLEGNVHSSDFRLRLVHSSNTFQGVVDNLSWEEGGLDESEWDPDDFLVTLTFIEELTERFEYWLNAHGVETEREISLANSAGTRLLFLPDPEKRGLPSFSHDLGTLLDTEVSLDLHALLNWKAQGLFFSERGNTKKHLLLLSLLDALYLRVGHTARHEAIHALVENYENIGLPHPMIGRFSSKDFAEDTWYFREGFAYEEPLAVALSVSGSISELEADHVYLYQKADYDVYRNRLLLIYIGLDTIRQFAGFSLQHTNSVERSVRARFQETMTRLKNLSDFWCEGFWKKVTGGQNPYLWAFWAHQNPDIYWEAVKSLRPLQSELNALVLDSLLLAEWEDAPPWRKKAFNQLLRNLIPDNPYRRPIQKPELTLPKVQ